MKYSNNKNGTEAVYSLSEFAELRHNMVSAPTPIILQDAALEHEWFVSESGKDFREPTEEERASLHEKIWEIRGRLVESQDDCANRSMRFSFWRCEDCGAIWTQRKNGHSFGYPIEITELEERVTNLLRHYKPNTGRALECREEARRFLENYRRATHQGDDRVVVGIRQDRHCEIQFLTLRGSRDGKGNISTKWTSRWLLVFSSQPVINR